ncbi:MAG: DUF1801 domain-containing protein [Chloroflexota bacterium]|jgi:hypothetical protein
MAELKTRLTDKNPLDFLNAVADEKKRQDSFAILRLMEDATGFPAQMWGDNIVGFGKYRYRYASGHAGEWPLAAFSPRKQNLTLYIMAGFEQYETLMTRLGKHKTGKSCLYINKIEDIDLNVLRELVRASVAHMIATNP